MKHTARNVLYHEIIGLDAEVCSYPDPSLIGVKGRVIDETMKTIVLETGGNRRVRVFKEHAFLILKLPSGRFVFVKGFKLIGRPEDRLKRVLRRGV